MSTITKLGLALVGLVLMGAIVGMVSALLVSYIIMHIGG